MASPFTWIIFGAAAQLSLAAWVRSAPGWTWAMPPLLAIACLLAAVPAAPDGYPQAYQIGMAIGLRGSATWIASRAPAAMNMGLVLAITATYWTSFLVSGKTAWWGGFTFAHAALAAAIPTAILVAIVAAGHRPDRWLRFLLYLWALFALAVVGVMRFPLSDFTALESAGLGWVVILAAAYLGAHIAMLVHNVMSLLILIPFTGEGQRLRFSRG